MTDEPETTAVAVRQPAAPAIRQEFTDEQVHLIRTLCCNGCSADEFLLFMNQCRRTGLDPLSKQIHAVKRGGKMTIQVGIDGLRLVAERTGELDGQDGPYWCGPDGEWKDVWLDTAAKPAACKVTVFRKGQRAGYTGVARWAEFYQSAGGMWDKMPTVMIAKVAESIAIRKGFPQELSGLYADAEMDQSDRGPRPAGRAPTPAELMEQALTALDDAGDAEYLAHVWKQIEADRRKFDDVQWDRIVAASDKAKTRLSTATKPKPAEKPAERTVAALAKTLADLKPPATGVGLAERVDKIVAAMNEMTDGGFEPSDLDEAVANGLRLGDLWSYANMTAEQVKQAWSVVVEYIRGAAAQPAKV